MSSLYDRVASKPGGEAALAAARLRREMLVALHHAFAVSGLRTQSEVARRLGVRRSAVSQVFKGDGNLRVNTIAEYLFTLGFELDVNLVLKGEPRRAELEGRSPVHPGVVLNATINLVVIATTDEHSRLSLHAPTEAWTSWTFWHEGPSTTLAPLPGSTSQVVLGELVKEQDDAT